MVESLKNIVKTKLDGIEINDYEMYVLEDFLNKYTLIAEMYSNMLKDNSKMLAYKFCDRERNFGELEIEKQGDEIKIVFECHTYKCVILVNSSKVSIHLKESKEYVDKPIDKRLTIVGNEIIVSDESNGYSNVYLYCDDEDKELFIETYKLVKEKEFEK